MEVLRSGELLWSLPGAVPDVCGDCSLLDTLLGSGTILGCLVSLPFRADGLDILVIEIL